ncbi:MAG TPA: carbohydrate ABC transporter permease [Candidatus Aminicenantes bacterium]|nr:carbohydrate ABC transporter permease [Candidatus Aminicenantes bacterium]HRY66033.1 carbohydrate ABC transporter permease [Candidatus Aminicenantes bacterium]HRZ72918.1 carbohydrate ABC transporter permease [Candidatus Aminicenantes bacterium]
MSSRRELLGSVTRKALIYAGLAVMLALALAPIVWIFLISLKTDKDIIASVPRIVFTPTLENYKAILIGVKSAGGETARPEFVHYFLNSLIITSGAVLVSLLAGVPAAYALARFKIKLKENIAFTFLSFRFAPEIAVIIPIFVIYRSLGLYNTYVGMILVYQLVTLPLIIWLMRGYFEDIPESIEQAARLDGYSRFAIFRKICLPLVKPGLASTAILAFIFAWNNFIFGLVLGAKETFPVTVGMLGFISYESVLWGQMAAASMVTILPEIVIALFIQKYLVRGLSFGAVRG